MSDPEQKSTRHPSIHETVNELLDERYIELFNFPSVKWTQATYFHFMGMFQSGLLINHI